MSTFRVQNTLLLHSFGVVVFVAITGWLISALPDFDPISESSSPNIIAQPFENVAKSLKDKDLSLDESPQPSYSLDSEQEQLVHVRFKQAVAMLHAKQYEMAFTALHEVLALAPRMPEAHVNIGFALIGMEDHKSAEDFFLTAIELNPEQANAYYGLALALERQGDLQGALGAMRTYIHRTTQDDPYVRNARAALWEWEEALKSKD